MSERQERTDSHIKSIRICLVESLAEKQFGQTLHRSEKKHGEEELLSNKVFLLFVSCLALVDVISHLPHEMATRTFDGSI